MGECCRGIFVVLQKNGIGIGTLFVVCRRSILSTISLAYILHSSDGSGLSFRSLVRIRPYISCSSPDAPPVASHISTIVWVWGFTTVDPSVAVYTTDEVSVSPLLAPECIGLDSSIASQQVYNRHRLNAVANFDRLEPASWTILDREYSS